MTSSAFLGISTQDQPLKEIGLLDLTCFQWAQLIKKSDLPANAKYLALYLSTFMNMEHNIAWPSQSRISYETGLSEPTVRKWLEYLAEKEWLLIRRGTREVQTKGGFQLQNEYLINIPIKVIRGVSSLPTNLQGGQTVDERWVNESSKVGKQLTPNNNSNNNINNNRQKIKKLPYWTDDQAWMDLGNQIGKPANLGESMDQYKNRIKNLIESST